MKNLWQWFKDRGGNATILVIFLAIVVAVPYFVFFGEEYAELSGFRKVLSVGSFFGAIVIWVAGDSLRLFTPNDESKWKMGHLFWKAFIFALFIVAVIAATA